MPVQQCQTGKQPILLILSLANLRPADENPQTKKINMFHMHTYNPSPQHLVHPCCGLAPAPSKSAVMKSSPSAFHILNWLQYLTPSSGLDFLYSRPASFCFSSHSAFSAVGVVLEIEGPTRA